MNRPGLWLVGAGRHPPDRPPMASKDSDRLYLLFIATDQWRSPTKAPATPE
jgi:hypothetical protein